MSASLRKVSVKLKDKCVIAKHGVVVVHGDGYQLGALSFTMCALLLR